jgi:hypothetical protein
MYNILLMLHNTTRWLVLIALLWILYRAWSGWLRKREWSTWDTRAGMICAAVLSIQFVFGLLLYVQPTGLAQAAMRDFSAAMKVRELRFFGLEHPLQMIIAIGLVHLGSARARKAVENAKKYRWALICYTLAAIAILIAIPWWRPLLRGLS